jgi:hypothetical protein
MAEVPGAQAALAPDSALPEIPHGGTVWVVGRPDQDARARLEKLAKKVAIDRVRELKDALDPDAYREMFDSVTRALPSYNTWGEGWQRTVLTPDGAHLFLWSLLQAKHPAVTEAQVLRLARECPEEVSFAVAQVVPAFFQMLLSELLARVPPEQRAGAEQQAAQAMAEARRLLSPTAGPNS